MQITTLYLYAPHQNLTGIQHLLGVKHVHNQLHFIIKCLTDARNVHQLKSTMKLLDPVKLFVKVAPIGTQQAILVYKIQLFVQLILFTTQSPNYARNALKEILFMTLLKEYALNVLRGHIQILLIFHVMHALIKLHIIIKPSFVILLLVSLENIIVLLLKLVFKSLYALSDNTFQSLMKSA